ncbi:MAG: YihY/virulence factor BrkB family protein [Candidatus Dormibacteraeota bacterium]|nr:YihY/virulence factor BrkB family protein [Candidatus Dormibacteraeota bacterium]
MGRLRRLADRARNSLPFKVVTAFGESQASNYASALAFAAFLAMFPMMLGALSIIGLAIRDPVTEARFQALILQVFPGNAQSELQQAIHGVKQSAGWMGVVSLGGLIWSAGAIFATMEFALTQIFGTKQRDMLRQKLMGFVMMVLLVVALAITLAANSAAGYLSNYIPFAWVLGFLFGAAVMVALLVLLYRFVPNRTFSLREVLPGAVIAGVLIEVLSLAFPLYARFAGGFNTYGAQFGLFFLLASWLYLLSELLLLGAVYNRFRLGQPATKGLIASPAQESHEPERPVEVIKRKKKGGAEGGSSEPPAAGTSTQKRSVDAAAHRSLFQRAVLFLVVSAAVAEGVIGRRAGRGKRSISS